MFKYFLLVLSLALFAAADVEEISPFLTSNVLAVSGEFPSSVLIRSQSPAQPFCGGTIVDRQHILTSAQCVVNNQNQLINPFWFQVIAGDLNVLNPTIRRETRNVTRIFIHPNYNPATRNNDLAILRVGLFFPDFHNSIEPAIRNARLLPDLTACRFAAWGTATNVTNAPIQPDLRAINAPIIPSANCNAGNVFANRVLNVMLCAGSITATNPVSGACRGNIGSGLYCNNALTGVLTFGQSCGAVNMPGVFMDVRQYNDWIVQQFTRTDNPQPGV